MPILRYDHLFKWRFVNQTSNQAYITFAETEKEARSEIEERYMIGPDQYEITGEVFIKPEI